jgi:hypothetical protein
MDITSQTNLLLTVSYEIIHFFWGIAINLSVDFSADRQPLGDGG